MKDDQVDRSLDSLREFGVEIEPARRSHQNDLDAIMEESVRGVARRTSGAARRLIDNLLRYPRGEVEGRGGQFRPKRARGVVGLPSREERVKSRDKLVQSLLSAAQNEREEASAAVNRGQMNQALDRYEAARRLDQEAARVATADTPREEIDMDSPGDLPRATVRSIWPPGADSPEFDYDSDLPVTEAMRIGGYEEVTVATFPETGKRLLTAIDPRVEVTGWGSSGTGIVVVEDHDFDEADLDMVSIQSFDNWIADVYPEQYLGQREWNEEFWASPYGLFHGTGPDAVDDIRREGLLALDQTRGSLNRLTGSAVFAHPNPEYAREYAARADGLVTREGAIVEIDIKAMKEAGVVPEAGPEEPIREAIMKESLAWSLGVEDYYDEAPSWDGIDRETIVIYGSVPPEFLRVYPILDGEIVTDVMDTEAMAVAGGPVSPGMDSPGWPDGLDPPRRTPKAVDYTHQVGAIKREMNRLFDLWPEAADLGVQLFWMDDVWSRPFDGMRPIDPEGRHYLHVDANIGQMRVPFTGRYGYPDEQWVGNIELEDISPAFIWGLHNGMFASASGVYTRQRTEDGLTPPVIVYNLLRQGGPDTVSGSVEKITDKARHTITHEFGHLVLDEILVARHGIEFGDSPFEDRQTTRFSVMSKLAKDLLEEYDITPEEIATVSNYATTDPSEAFAELYTTVFTPELADRLDLDLRRKFLRLVREELPGHKAEDVNYRLTDEGRERVEASGGRLIRLERERFRPERRRGPWLYAIVEVDGEEKRVLLGEKGDRGPGLPALWDIGPVEEGGMDSPDVLTERQTPYEYPGPEEHEQLLRGELIDWLVFGAKVHANNPIRWEIDNGDPGPGPFFRGQPPNTGLTGPRSWSKNPSVALYHGDRLILDRDNEGVVTNRMSVANSDPSAATLVAGTGQVMAVEILMTNDVARPGFDLSERDTGYQWESEVILDAANWPKGAYATPLRIMIAGPGETVSDEEMYERVDKALREDHGYTGPKLANPLAEAKAAAMDSPEIVVSTARLDTALDAMDSPYAVMTEDSERPVMYPLTQAEAEQQAENWPNQPARVAYLADDEVRRLQREMAASLRGGMDSPGGPAFPEAAELGATVGSTPESIEEIPGLLEVSDRALVDSLNRWPRLAEVARFYWSEDSLSRPFADFEAGDGVRLATGVPLREASTKEIADLLDAGQENKGSHNLSIEVGMARRSDEMLIYDPGHIDNLGKDPFWTIFSRLAHRKSADDGRNTLAAEWDPSEWPPRPSRDYTITAYEAIILHEIGHSVMFAIDPRRDDTRQSRLAVLFDDFGITPEMVEQVSTYATVNMDEAFAELYAYYFSDLHDEMDEELRIKFASLLRAKVPDHELRELDAGLVGAMESPEVAFPGAADAGLQVSPMTPFVGSRQSRREVLDEQLVRLLEAWPEMTANTGVFIADDEESRLVITLVDEVLTETTPAQAAQARNNTALAFTRLDANREQHIILALDKDPYYVGFSNGPGNTVPARLAPFPRITDTMPNGARLYDNLEMIRDARVRANDEFWRLALIHEVGHVVHTRIIPYGGSSLEDYLATLLALLQRYGITPEEIAEVSGYAALSSAEAFAEMFTLLLGAPEQMDSFLREKFIALLRAELPGLDLSKLLPAAML